MRFSPWIAAEGGDSSLTFSHVLRWGGMLVQQHHGRGTSLRLEADISLQMPAN
jgi:hypothetical protein